MLKSWMAVVVMVLLTMLCAHADQDNGQPFGRMTEQEFEAFERFAASHGFDVEGEMKKVYAGDADAFVRVFQFSMRFTRLDANTRAYGNLLYSAFLNIMESGGDGVFVAALAKSPDDVRQRARDFFYYPMRKVPRRHRAEVEKEVRRDFPRIFPPEYEFGKDDALFDGTANNRLNLAARGRPVAD